ncbi:MAG: Flp pilus assembly complex ATPase component TadA [Candidatus Omnitrophica bacterium]|nr:Flp pilus assembly complex ATPase component TadA [Candidatus Omnitrophota bacterium]
MISFKQRITEILIEQKLATPEQIESIVNDAVQTKKSFARLLIDRGVVNESKLTELLSKELGLPMISLAKYRIDPNVAKSIPERMARQYRLIALSKFGNRMVVAMADPMNIFAIDDLKVLTQVAIDPVLSPETDILRAIEQIYASPTSLSETPEGETQDVAVTKDDNIDTAVALLLNEAGAVDEAPVVKVINLMVMEAMRRHASDIHLEPMKNLLRVRYRIDGHLMEIHRLPRAVQSPILTRLKIMSGLDITEWRLPQDGRFKVRVDDKEVDFRVSVLPITNGGKVVLRLLDKANLSMGLDYLGFTPASIEQFKMAIKRPYGMILVTGPTGSGKSTTLYSVLNVLASKTKNLITIEDPVEYQIEGVTQMQVNTDIGLTFAGGLRTILRQSPDVVMIGEIRDFETADIAMKASLTGQLVLSTLHTNDAPSAVTRLIDMGVEPFLVASSVSLIQAQRLVRKLCTKCRERVDPPAELLERLKIAPSPEATFYRAKGCRLCRDTGYRGRMGIVEVFPVDERVRELIVARAQSWQIKEHAVKELKMVPLRQDGFHKAEQGLTTLEEVVAVTTEE